MANKSCTDYEGFDSIIIPFLDPSRRSSKLSSIMNLLTRGVHGRHGASQKYQAMLARQAMRKDSNHDGALFHINPGHGESVVNLNCLALS